MSLSRNKREGHYVGYGKLVEGMGRIKRRFHYFCCTSVVAKHQRVHFPDKPKARVFVVGARREGTTLRPYEGDGLGREFDPHCKHPL